MSSIASKCKSIVAFLNLHKIDDAEAFLADGQFHAWRTFLNQPGTPKIAVGFGRAEARVNFPGGDITGRENEYIWCIIARGRGGTQDRAANVYEGVAGGSPLLVDAEILRDGLRAMRFDPKTDEQPDYVGIEEWGLKEGFNIDGYKITIWVGSQKNNYSPMQLAQEPG
jgi:hypothetical protein